MANISQIDYLLKKQNIIFNLNDLNKINNKDELLLVLTDNKSVVFQRLHTIEISTYNKTEEEVQNWIKNEFDISDSFFNDFSFTSNWELN